MRRILTLLLAFVLIAPAAAQASSDALIADCTKDSKLDKKYSQKEYKDALKDLGADADEYTNCRDIIGRAQQAAARGSGQEAPSRDSGGDASSGGAGPASGAGGTGGGEQQPAPGQPAAEPPPTPAETQALEQTKADGNRAVLNAARVASAPGVESDTELPTAVIVLLIALALGAAALSAQRLTSLVSSRRST